jgi:hypothetical protein
LRIIVIVDLHYYTFTGTRCRISQLASYQTSSTSSRALSKTTRSSNILWVWSHRYDLGSHQSWSHQLRTLELRYPHSPIATRTTRTTRKIQRHSRPKYNGTSPSSNARQINPVIANYTLRCGKGRNSSVNIHISDRKSSGALTKSCGIRGKKRLSKSGCTTSVDGVAGYGRGFRRFDNLFLLEIEVQCNGE